MVVDVATNAVDRTNGADRLPAADRPFVPPFVLASTPSHCHPVADAVDDGDFAAGVAVGIAFAVGPGAPWRDGERNRCLRETVVERNRGLGEGGSLAPVLHRSGSCLRCRPLHRHSTSDDDDYEVQHLMHPKQLMKQQPSAGRLQPRPLAIDEQQLLLRQ